jgi:phosphatidylglycerol---prolipoprotein diacylglyceryl transferase
MKPILFRWGSFTIWSYPAMLYIGLVAGVVAGNAAAHAAGLDAFRVFVATYILIVPALIGARLLDVASHWRIYRQSPRRIWNRSEGGAAQYGGLALALPLSVPLLAALQLPLGAFWDVAMLTVLVGMIFTRIGCLMNGCCAGRPSQTWISVYLPDHRGVWARRIPTQCLEAAWAVVLLVSAIGVWPRLPFPGALFLFVAAGYAAGRLALESMREQHPGAPRFTIHHAISALMIVLSLVALTAGWPK